MTKHLKHSVYLVLGGMFFIIGLIGVFIPILPTTPFMILAAAFFSESSPRLHKALLNNRWFGADLRRWEEERIMKRATKKRATWIIIISFSLSISILWGHLLWQWILLGLAFLLLFFLWRVSEIQVEEIEK